MIWPKYRRYLLPIVLGALGLLLLGRVLISGALILIPEDLDVVLLVSLLSVIMVVAIHTIVQISMRYLRLLSVQRVRQETLAEHSRFLRRLDHELKNPLTTLRAGLSTLSLTNLDEQQRQVVKTMETETMRLSRLVTDLRKLAELEAQPLNLQPVNLNAFVKNIIQIERDRFEGGQRLLRSHVGAARPVWVVDEDLLALVIHNLLDNAFKYTQPADTIRLEVSAQNELIIRVIDTGAGIPPSLLPHIWEELYRGDEMEKAPGSGIGLALVKAIVERHNGSVLIESEPGQGTTVSIHLPPVSQP
jgi:two-component system OmpR family sensor kinase